MAASRIAVLCLSLSCLAWQGGGSGVGYLAEGGMAGRVAMSAAGRIDDKGGTVVFVLELPPPLGDGVVSLTLRGADSGRVDIVSGTLAAVLEVYDDAGRTEFFGHAVNGSIALSFGTEDALSLTGALDFDDGEGRVQRLTDVRAYLASDQNEHVESANGSSVAVGAGESTNSGCASDGYEDPYLDDNREFDQSRSADDTESGCDSSTSDPSGVNATDDSESGCEGDGLEGESETSSSCGDSCEGDARAAALLPRAPGRDRVFAKLIAWSPYLLILLGLPLFRRLSRSRRLARKGSFR